MLECVSLFECFPAGRGETSVLIVKNLNYRTDSDGLREAFESATTARVVMDWDSGRSRGYVYFVVPSTKGVCVCVSVCVGRCRRHVYLL